MNRPAGSRPRLSFERKLAVAFVVAMLIMLLIGIQSYRSTRAFLKTVDERTQSQEAVTALQAILANTNSARGTARGYYISGDTTLMPFYRDARVGVKVSLNQLKQTPEYAVQRSAIDSLEGMLIERMELADNRMDAFRQGGLAAVASTMHGDEDDKRIENLADTIAARITKRVEAHEMTALRQARRTLTIVTIGTVFALALIAVSTLVVRREVVARQRAYDEADESQHRLTQILDNTPVGVFVVDRDGAATYVNDAARAILSPAGNAAETAEAVLGAYSIYPVGSDVPIPSRDRPIARALTGHATGVMTIEVHRGDRAVPIEVTAAPIFDNDGEISGAVAAFADITERREIDRMKDELVSVVSHELRTPLTSIRGALGLIGSGRLGTLNDDGQRMVRIATADTDRLVRLINDMLDMERMSAGGIVIHPARCDVGTLVGQAIAAMQPLAETAHVRMVSEISAESVWCDAERVSQTLTNLIGNAIKFSPRDGVVTVSVERIGPDVVFRVADDGRGIPRHRLESIFDRFQQVDASDAREKGGTGLGLAISRGIVLQHGGRIWAESDGEHGSTFVFTLPQPVEGNAEPAIVGGTLLLVAEAGSMAADGLKETLEAKGYAVWIAGNGRVAIELARQLKPAAILLDLVMPEMSGWEAMAHLKADAATSDIPIVIVSGMVPDLPQDDPRVAGWVETPFDAQQIKVALRGALGHAGAPVVLIVEDDRHLADVLAAHFENTGLKAIRALTGTEAIRLADEHQPDLLVLDLMLPDKDGFAVVDWLRQHERLRNLPLVIYSALDLNNADRDKLTLGPSVFITKSRESPDAVVQRVASLLESVKTPRPEKENA